MLGTMRERLSAKLGNNNDNAFKLRKLSKMYDKREAGMVRQHKHWADLSDCLGGGNAACHGVSKQSCTQNQSRCSVATPGWANMLH